MLETTTELRKKGTYQRHTGVNPKRRNPNTTSFSSQITDIVPDYNLYYKPNESQSV